MLADLARPIQRVRVAFIYPAQHGAAFVEFVEPAGDHATGRTFLERGGGLHHFSYEANDIVAEIDWAPSLD
jgi:hypothetical protein